MTADLGKFRCILLVDEDDDMTFLKTEGGKCMAFPMCPMSPHICVFCVSNLQFQRAFQVLREGRAAHVPCGGYPDGHPR